MTERESLICSILLKMGKRGKIAPDLNVLLHRLSVDGPPHNLTDEEAVFLSEAAKPDRNDMAPFPAQTKMSQPPRQRKSKAVFCDVLRSYRRVSRDDLIRKMTSESGCALWTALNYIAEAKREGNRFGILIGESRSSVDSKKEIFVLSEFNPKGALTMSTAVASVGGVVREKMIGLLAKMGVEIPDEMTAERVKKKLVRRLSHADGNLAKLDLTDEELGLVEGLGFSVPDSGKAADSNNGDDEGAEKPVKKVKAAKSEAKSDDKPEAKTKAKKAPKDAGEKKPVKKRDSSAASIFKQMFEVSPGPVLRDAILKKLTGAGLSEVSAVSYITWAKRTEFGPASKTKNPFGFVLTEAKDDKGKKVLTRKK